MPDAVRRAPTEALRDIEREPLFAATPPRGDPTMTPLDEIRDLFAYNRWANARIFEAAARLSPAQFDRDLGSSFPSVHDTLAHIVMAEWVWWMRWEGTSPRGIPDAWDLSTPDAIRARLTEVERDRDAFLDGLDEADLHRTIEYRDVRGTPFAAPLWQLLRHVVNHSTYHRGQVVTLLRQLGADGVATDLVAFHRERAAAPAAASADRAASAAEPPEPR